MKFTITDHALRRYMERIDRCSKAQAFDRMMHAAEISRPASPKQIWTVTSKNGSRVGKMQGYLIRYCPIESLILICRRNRLDQKVLAVVTVYRLREN